jgi:hypothetical protein
MKTCCRCKTEKGDQDFYTVKAGGLSSWCRKCQRDHASVWCKNNRIQKNDINRKWRLNNPDRVKLMTKSTNAIWKAIREGKLLRGTTCEKCQSTKNIQAAHFDYDQLLNVKWLCIKCHSLWDAEFPKTKPRTETGAPYTKPPIAAALPA